MKKITKIALAITLALSLFSVPKAQRIEAQIEERNREAQNTKPKIQIAILLDSSNSMDGLIDQTRYQLWEIVNSLTKVTKDGVVPELEVALYHYGNDTLPSSEGYLRLLKGFTPELDLISENLFGIETNGGQEYAGWVIQSAMNELEWSDSDEDFKAIFIAGNEPFNQGPVNWEESVDIALDKDTLINTIYCGGEESQERDLWATGATSGGGSHLVINQNQEIAFIESPYDEEITLLNRDLNSTYIPYGLYGEEGLTRQATEDANAAEQIVTRGVSKVSGYYNNASWDLVDAIANDEVTLEELDEEYLPSDLQDMDIEAQAEYIETQQNERNRIQERIRELSDLRDEYVETQREAQSEDTLDFVMISTLQNQLEEKGFTLNE